ncbi:hypothetical protein M378DRAFT_167895 [Amanita muscaria Koide BX008]|uniref:Uncharacterized protein n=1 Tax=Amanita muscaria (strain Koide BX008) TaxID=946122 RepID=A0A0C2WGT3_AMAMK|nr:hypothetical protein M378DRAFT_167895 [Amanita muscaria Koide BX008]
MECSCLTIKPTFHSGTFMPTNAIYSSSGCEELNVLDSSASAHALNMETAIACTHLQIAGSNQTRRFRPFTESEMSTICVGQRSKCSYSLL